MAFEERAYTVVQSDRSIEVRDYDPAIVAETIVDAEFEDAGSPGFRILVEYISGANTQRESIAMTAPVTQIPEGERIAMTAPVTQELVKQGYRITFMMPSGRTLEDLPIPLDDRIVLREEPGQRYVAIRYSGFWSEKNYQQKLETLTRWMSEKRLKAQGPAIWARYDPPFMPWFFRRNEILIPIKP